MTAPLDKLRGILLNQPSQQLIDRYSFTGDIHPYTVCSKQYGTFEHYGFARALPIQAWFGDVVHMTIEMLFRQVCGDIGDSEGKIQPDLLPGDKDVEFHATTAISIMKSKGINARESSHEVVINLIKKFNTTEGLNFYKRIVKSEVRLETIMEPEDKEINPYIMNGVIDVLISSTKGSLEIWDYKAMRKPAENDPKLLVLKKQMYNYVEIVQLLYPDNKISTAVLYFVNELLPDGSGKPEYRIDLTDPEISSSISEARTFANEVVKKIRDGKTTGKFPLPGKGTVDSQTCGACFLRWSCPSTDKEYTLQAP